MDPEVPLADQLKAIEAACDAEFDREVQKFVNEIKSEFMANLQKQGPTGVRAVLKTKKTLTWKKFVSDPDLMQSVAVAATPLIQSQHKMKMTFKEGKDEEYHPYLEITLTWE